MAAMSVSVLSPFAAETVFSLNVVWMFVIETSAESEAFIHETPVSTFSWYCVFSALDVSKRRYFV